MYAKYLLEFLLSIVRPETLRIVGVPLPMSAGQRYDVTCQAVGARPVPNITWWVGETRVDHLQTRLEVS